MEEHSTRRFDHIWSSSFD